MDALEVVIENFACGLEDSAEIVQCLIGQYFDDEMTVKIAGGKYPKFIKADPSELMGRVRIKPIGVSEAMRRKMEARESVSMMSVISGAAAQGALQGVDLRSGWRQLLEDLDWRGLDRFMPDDEDRGAGYWQQEQWMWETGGDPEVNPLDDDEEHLMFHEEYAKGDKFKTLDLLQQRRIDAHIANHQAQWASKRQKRLIELQAKAMEAAGMGGGAPGGDAAGPGRPTTRGAPGGATIPSPAMLAGMDASGGGSGGLRAAPQPGQMGMPQGRGPAQVGSM